MFRRSPTPESPRPYLTLENKVSSPFPPLTADESPLALKDLPPYVREFNATNTKMMLHIYMASGRESRNVTVPVVLRFLIPDVLRAFITLGHEEGSNGAVSESSALIVESLTVFGSREKACTSLNTGCSCIQQPDLRNHHIHNPNSPSSRSCLNGLYACYSCPRVCPCRASW